MNSIKVDVGGGETVVFENGPRSLRPTSTNGIVTLDLVSSILRPYLNVKGSCPAIMSCFKTHLSFERGDRTGIDRQCVFSFIISTDCTDWSAPSDNYYRCKVSGSSKQIHLLSRPLGTYAWPWRWSLAEC